MEKTDVAGIKRMPYLPLFLILVTTLCIIVEELFSYTSQTLNTDFFYKRINQSIISLVLVAIVRSVS